MNLARGILSKGLREQLRSDLDIVGYALQKFSLPPGGLWEGF